MSRLEIPEGVN